ncbi:2,3-diaminopropionate biosynthesis protein SbnA [Sphingobacterium hungaricum]|uniref:N-(2-amino-2-carboxyethyl)-L-glutamate synthase n=1 Tax=Sphingobacterium hungaricum TaxID=2082723 RepID=A0A928YTG8_9SPHI|nr:2,3-diaminopropionate biosynthesis protein SbnA [Sphingobacterium hungaricum]MBE8715153.1 2,3-diaminopropionate biosynthesis protein SbnA [Sphingobacterium hungaricum]
MIKVDRAVDGVLSLIGNTPLVNLKNIFAAYNFDLYGKMEMQNPGGSIKDRTSYRIISQALNEGKINADTVIIESTSGNMGIGLAQICLHYGLKLILVVDPHINKQARQLVETYGAEFVMVDEHDGKGGYLNTRLKMVDLLLKRYPNSFNPDQYHNKNNPLAHAETVREINQSLGFFPDYIFVPTSTCGTLMGIAQEYRRLNADTKIIAVDSVGSVIFDQKPQVRNIPGMGSSRSSDFLDQRLIHDVIHVSDEETIMGCHQLLNKECILAGGSSGATIKAIEKYTDKINPNSTIISILSDRGERYLDTIYSKSWINETFGKTLSITNI